MAAESKATTINAWLGVATGLLTVITLAAALFGVNKGQQAADSQQQASSASSSAASEQTAAGATISSLQSENSVLKSSNSVLSEQLASATVTTPTAIQTTSTSSTPVTPAPPTGAIYDSGVVAIQKGGAQPDLDAMPGTVPQWKPAGFFQAEFAPTNDPIIQIQPLDKTMAVKLADGSTPSYATCAAAVSQATTNNINTANLNTGDLVCVITNAGRVATMVVRDGKTDTSITFDTVVYKKTGD